MAQSKSHKTRIFNYLRQNSTFRVKTLWLPLHILPSILFPTLKKLHSQKRRILVQGCQIYRLVATCQQVATNLSISSSCNRSVKMRLVITCHLQNGYNLFKQLAASLWITSFENQLATSLLTISNRFVATSCRKPYERILISACCYNSVARCQQTCGNLGVFSYVYFFLLPVVLD